ncbi:hypothetical protein Tco_0354622, partial [Tanacetum coccineum]
ILVLAYETMINYGNSVMSSRKSEFPTKSDEGFFVGYSLSSKAFREHFLKTLQDASYFDASPRSVADAQIQDQNGLNDENGDS